MELTMKENLNIKSLVLRHEILEQAIVLLKGREEALQTEKDLYLSLSMINAVCNEDIIAYCNDTTNNLTDIMKNDIEPIFIKLMENIDYYDCFMYLRQELNNYCKKLWDEQHNIIGVIDTLLSSIGNITEEDKKDVLIKTGEMAAHAEEEHNKKLEAIAQDSNDKLAALVQKYQREAEQKRIENDTK